MKRLMLNKELYKESIHGLSMVMLVAGFAQLLTPIVVDESVSTKLTFGWGLAGLIIYIDFYIAIHILFPIIKLYFPSFVGPADEVVPKSPRWKILLDPAVHIFIWTAVLLTWCSFSVVVASITIGAS